MGLPGRESCYYEYPIDPSHLHYLAPYCPVSVLGHGLAVRVIIWTNPLGTHEMGTAATNPVHLDGRTSSGVSGIFFL